MSNSAIAPAEPALLLTIKQVATLVNLKPRTLWRFISQDQFPRPAVSIGSRIRRWKRADVEAWIEAQIGGKQ